MLNKMTDSELYATDRSLSNSVSISFSDDTAEDSSEDDRSRSSVRAKKKYIFLPPEEKLEKCERKYTSYLDKDNVDKAFKELLYLVPLRRLVYGDRHWKYAEAYYMLAKGYFNFKQCKIQALNHAEKAKSLILSCDSPDTNEKLSFSKCLVEIYLILGKSLAAIGGKNRGAENALQKSLQALKSLNKQESSIQIPSEKSQSSSIKMEYQIKFTLSDVYIASKQIDKATSVLQRLVEIISSDTLQSKELLTQIYSQLIRAEKARKKSKIDYELIIDYAIKAHESSTTSHALNSVEVADTAFALGQAYASIDSAKTQTAAETYFNESHAVYQNCYDDAHPKTLRVQDALIKLFMREGKDEKALKSLRNSLSKKSIAHGECSFQVSETHKLIAGIHLTKGNLKKAHQSLQQCLTIENELYGGHHLKTKTTQKMISQIEENPVFKTSNQTKLAERPKFLTTIKSPK